MCDTADSGLGSSRCQPRLSDSSASKGVAVLESLMFASLSSLMSALTSFCRISGEGAYVSTVYDTMDWKFIIISVPLYRTLL